MGCIIVSSIAPATGPLGYELGHCWATNWAAGRTFDPWTEPGASLASGEMGIVSGGGEGGERRGQKGGISTRGLVPVKRRTGRPGCCRFGVDATFSVGDVDMLHGDGRRTVDAHDAAPTQTHRARME